MTMSVRSHFLFQENLLLVHNNVSSKRPGDRGRADRSSIVQCRLMDRNMVLAITRKDEPHASPPYPRQEEEASMLSQTDRLWPTRIYLEFLKSPDICNVC